MAKETLAWQIFLLIFDVNYNVRTKLPIDACVFFNELEKKSLFYSEDLYFTLFMLLGIFA